MQNTSLIARLISIALLSSVASVANAQDIKAGHLTINHVHARATGAGQSTGAAYLTINNRGADDRLLSASADVSASVELHSMTMDEMVMRMRQVDSIAVPGGKVLELKPGGLHIMLVGLKAPLKAGGSVPMKLKFEKAGEVTVKLHIDAVDGDHSAHGH